jgi:hypothetical protein
VTVSTQHLQVTAGGAPATFTVVLNSKPAADVNVTLTQFNLSFSAELLAAASGANGGLPIRTGGATTLTLDPTHLTFTADNWNQPQTVKVSAPAGSGSPGGGVVWISGTTASTDPNFDAQAVPPVTVSVIGSNAVNPAGLTLSKTDLVVQRGGPGDSYTIALTSKPTADVTVTISQVSPENWAPTLADGTPGSPVANAQLTITPSTLTFTADNWNTPQTVQVSAPAGQRIYPVGVLLFQTVTSTDPNYNNLVVPPVTVRVENNASVGVVLSKEHLQVTRGGAGDSYTVALASKPTANVTITIAQASPDQPVTFVADGPGDCPIVAPPWPYNRDPLVITPTTLTFTPDNWNTPQTVQVDPPTTGSGEQIDLILMKAASDDKNYDGLRLPVVTVAVTGTSASKAALVFSTQQLDVTAGGPAASYTVALATKPTANVTVTINQVSPLLGGPGSLWPDAVGAATPSPVPLGGPQLTITPTTLTFTPDNWNTPQTVQVSAPAATGAASIPTRRGEEIVFLEHQVASQDANYNGLLSQPVMVHVEDNVGNAGGAVVSKDHLEVTRGGAGDSFTVALTSKPTANVTVTITQVNSEEPPPGVRGDAVTPSPVGHDPLVITPTTLTFTPDNWNTPQTVNVGPPTSGSGDQTDFLVLTATSTDPNYNRRLPTVSVSVVDPSAEEAGLVLSQHELDVTRGGAAATFTIALASKPSADVTVTVSQISPVIEPLAAAGSGGTGSLTITPTTLTFTADNWNTPQTVSVSAPAATAAGPGLPDIVFIEQKVTSNDPNYNNLSSPPVYVQVENPTPAGKAGLVISKDQLAVNPGGTGDSYTIALASKPTADVTITIAQVSEFLPPLAALRNPGGNGGSPGATTGNVMLTITPPTLTFTADNWNSPQTVSVSAPALSGQAGGAFAQVDWLVTTVTSKDTDYSGLFVPPLAVAVVTPGQKLIVPMLPPILPPAEWISYDTPPAVEPPVTVSPPTTAPGSPGNSRPTGNGHGSGAGAAHHGQTAHHARKAHHGKH